MMKWNFEYVCEFASKRGYLREDLFALLQNRDPFRAESPRNDAWVDWFMEVWERYGCGEGVHLRKIHYRLVVEKPLLRIPQKIEERSGKKTNDKYLNTDACWNSMCGAAALVRYRGLIAPEIFVDRRSPPVQIFRTTQQEDPRIGVGCMKYRR